MMYSRFDKFSSASEIEVISKGILHPPKNYSLSRSHTHRLGGYGIGTTFNPRPPIGLKKIASAILLGS